MVHCTTLCSTSENVPTTLAVFHWNTPHCAALHFTTFFILYFLALCCTTQCTVHWCVSALYCISQNCTVHTVHCAPVTPASSWSVDMTPSFHCRPSTKSSSSPSAPPSSSSVQSPSAPFSPWNHGINPVKLIIIPAYHLQHRHTQAFPNDSCFLSF